MFRISDLQTLFAVQLCSRAQLRQKKNWNQRNQQIKEFIHSHDYMMHQVLGKHTSDWLLVGAWPAWRETDRRIAMTQHGFVWKWGTQSSHS